MMLLPIPSFNFLRIFCSYCLAFHCMKMVGFIHSLSSSLFSICQTFVLLLFFVANVESLFFNFSSFDLATSRNISYNNDSAPLNEVIQLTMNRADGGLNHSVGRVSYNQPVRLWDRTTNKITDFTVPFSFSITQLGNDFGDGIAFFLAPFDETTAYAPYASDGGCLGLIGGHNGSCNATSKYPFVAVEFDTFYNGWDPSCSDLSCDHLGIDVTSVTSEVSTKWRGGVYNETKTNALINYDSYTKNLSVFLSYDRDLMFDGESTNLSYVIDLRSILPEKVRVGFSSTTGSNFEIHNILSWDFNSTLVDTDIVVSTPPQIPPSTQPTGKSQGKSKTALVRGVLAGSVVLTIVLSLIGLMWWKKSHRARRDDLDTVNNDDFDELMDDDFDKETGPRRFTYQELSRATNNFAQEGKLGEGGFGCVYIGFLEDLCRDIAVKKMSRETKQGIKEYMSEVKIFSQLRHKNLVQLLGWCHERGNLLLVYEFMPNGSLDSHLYQNKLKSILKWTTRYIIAQGLASALLYLHEEWEQCVLHRDIKSSNVMLDIDFNAKLGDFGLARLVDHNITSQTTLLAGTLGYLAPEIVNTGKASKEADIYSFGVVTLEIACGRKPVDSKEEPSKVKMVDWVWNLYGEGRLLEAADTRLEGEFNIQQIECLMVVGLWCCHPDHTNRPSIRQALSVLNFESGLPRLPSKLPLPIYRLPPTNVETFYITSSSEITGSSIGTTSFSTQSAASGAAPLLSDNAIA